MPRYTYINKSFSAKSLDIIDKANAICAEYRAQGFDLTLRQLYYQFVARDWLANRQSEYKRLGSIITDARRAGHLDWLYIVDRTRNVRGGDGSMTDPSETIDPFWFSAALWEGQSVRMEVWVEKDALVDVIGRAANSFRVPFFSCRGYTSDSEMWSAAQRIEGYLDEDYVANVIILHLGDHDPSGIDMTRDIGDRLEMFLDGDGYDPYDVSINRIALNMDQILQYSPPPNPAKITDSRAKSYISQHGYESWELDALEPAVIRDLIQDHVRPQIDPELWQIRHDFEESQRDTLRVIKSHYGEVTDWLREQGLLNGQS